MSEDSSITNLPCSIYEEELNEHTTLDLSSRDLTIVPDLDNKLLCVLYLQNNKITTLPDNFFPSLPSLMWLDLRDNQLTDIPKSIQNHPSLTHLLLQNNKLTSLPNEMGTLVNIKAIQLNGNPLMYPPREIINAGVSKMISFLHNKYIEGLMASQSEVSEDTASTSGIFPENIFGKKIRSYNSVIDGCELESIKKGKTLSVQFNDKDVKDDSDGEEYYSKYKGKCPKLAESRIAFPPKSQSMKYVKPLFADDKKEQERKIKQSYLKDKTEKKHKELIATREKILQGRKNLELLRRWRHNYMMRQPFTDKCYKMDPSKMPYDTNPEYMTLLTREDIEKDLPDKYKKNLLRRCKPTMPRKGASDVHLAMRIKQLFENLEAIDLNGGVMTPRTEQKVLLNEIQKISEIKQKLMELSATNGRSVVVD